MFHSDPAKPAPWLEVLVVACLFAVMADGPPPGSNEAHYLTKAKHYWDPSFCEGDRFLDSADAHLVFYWAFGWVTLLTSLETAAWIGRIASWLLLAWGWQRLSAALLPLRGVAVLTAATFLLLQRNLHMAGEWVAGGVEAKCFAYGLVFHAMAFVVQGRWTRAWPCLGGAAALHVLVGGWSVIAAGLAFLMDRESRPLRANLLSIAAAGAIAAIGLVPALQLNSGSPEVADEAAYIYVYKRLPHHLAFHTFRPAFQWRFGIACAAWLLLWHQQRQQAQRGPWQRLHWLVAGAAAIAGAGVLIDLLLLQQPRTAASLLRFYWYRLADAMVPLGLTFAALGALLHLQAPMMRRLLTGLAWGVVMMICGQVATSHWTAPVPEAFIQPRRSEVAEADERIDQFRQWRDACGWLRENTPPGSIVLACRGQQTLKWYAHRGEVGNWKDVPQDAAEVVRWYRLQQELFPREVRRQGLTVWSDQELLAIMQRFGADYLLLDRAKSQRLPGKADFDRVHPQQGRSTFVIYRPRPASPPSLAPPETSRAPPHKGVGPVFSTDGTVGGASAARASRRNRSRWVMLYEAGR